MRRSGACLGVFGVTLYCVVCGVLPAAMARAVEVDASVLEELKHEIEELKRRDEQHRRRIEVLEQGVDSSQGVESVPGAGPAPLPGEPAPRPSSEEPESSGGVDAAESPQDPDRESRIRGDLYSRELGAARLRLIDVSLDVIAAGGFSSVPNDTIEIIEYGEHDPKRRGFTLQQAELGIQGAIDPYLRGDAFLVYFLDANNESRFELEEAFFTTMNLPFGLQDLGLQLQGGTYFTHFGRINAQHPHFWRWQDQPFVWSRILGPDGLRGPGANAAWLMPLPWFSELRLGMQNANGETQVSFLSSDEVFDDTLADFGVGGIGGRPIVYDEVHSLNDFTYLLRWTNGFDLSDTWSTQLGLSAALGPNGTGSDARSYVYGTDFVFKWAPLETDRGWPFVELQGELVRRVYEASANPAMGLPEGTLYDWGLYAYGLWGFHRGWAAGLRYEYGSGSGDSYIDGAFVSHEQDPFRSTRHRVSPLLIFHPSEFARFRLQYNFDHTPISLGAVGAGAPSNAHSVWLGVEFSLGAHAAHTY